MWTDPFSKKSYHEPTIIVFNFSYVFSVCYVIVITTFHVFLNHQKQIALFCGCFIGVNIETSVLNKKAIIIDCFVKTASIILSLWWFTSRWSLYMILICSAMFYSMVNPKMQSQFNKNIPVTYLTVKRGYFCNNSNYSCLKIESILYDLSPDTHTVVIL